MQSIEVETCSFRLSRAHLLLWAGGAHLLLLALMVLAINLAGLVVNPIWLIVMCIVPYAYWVAYCLKFRLTVSADGLGWVNFEGVDCFLFWSDIEKAERKNQIGLPMLVLQSKTQRGHFLVPVCVNNRDILRESILALAGETHPVAIAVGGSGQ
jgi:hypothetical protein